MLDGCGNQDAVNGIAMDFGEFCGPRRNRWRERHEFQPRTFNRESEPRKQVLTEMKSSFLDEKCNLETRYACDGHGFGGGREQLIERRRQ